MILAPAVPLLGLALWNLESTPPLVVLWPIAIAAGIAGGAWMLLSTITREPRGAGLAVSLLMLAAMSHSLIVRFAADALMPAVVPAVYGLAIFAAAVSLRVGRRAPWLTVFANQSLALAVVFLSGQIAYDEWQRPTATQSAAVLQAAPGGDRPDVYVLILDGYGRADVLRDRYGFDNDLVPSLRSLGFSVADGAVANYPQTVHSLASSLNLEYLSELLRGVEPRVMTRRTLGDLVEHNRLFPAFRAAGYRVRFYRSEYELIRAAAATERPAPSGFMTSFDYSAIEASILPVMSRAVGLPRAWLPLRAHRRQVQWTLDDLSRVPDDSRSPSLVFAHVLAPHPPFAFNADGTLRRTSVPALMYDAEHWDAIAQGTGERYEAGYVDAIRFLNTRVTGVVQRVLATARRPTIFYIQGDHGPASRLTWDEPADQAVAERMGILLAMRFPDGTAPPLAPNITPVNAFRVLTNRALGTTLPLLPDRSYYASWTSPLAFVDVTHAVARRPPSAARVSGE